MPWGDGHEIILEILKWNEFTFYHTFVRHNNQIVHILSEVIVIGLRDGEQHSGAVRNDTECCCAAKGGISRFRRIGRILMGNRKGYRDHNEYKHVRRENHPLRQWAAAVEHRSRRSRTQIAKGGRGGRVATFDPWSWCFTVERPQKVLSTPGSS